MPKKTIVNPIGKPLDFVIDPTEHINHSELSDMPDSGGTNTDHDTRYWTQATDQTLLTGDKSGSFDLTTSGIIEAEHLKTTDDLEVADDILLGSGSVINFNSGNFTLTHSAGALTANGQIICKEGAVNAPALSFGTDTNSGWYFYQDGAVAWSGNGSKILHIQTTGIQFEKYLYMSSQRIEAVDWIGLATGSAGSPAIRFTSDTNTGIYRSGEDYLDFATGGLRRMFLNNEGLTIAGGALGSNQYTLNLGNNAQNLNGVGACMLRINSSSTAKYGNMMEIKSGTTAYDIINRRGFFYTGDSLTENPTSRIQNEGETFLKGRLVAGDTLVADTTSLGAEKITNGTFTGSAASWTYDATWAYGTNDIRKAASSGTGTLSQALVDMVTPIEVGKTYLLYFTLSSYTGADQASLMTVSCGGYSYQPLDSGVHKLVFKATTLDPLTFDPVNTGLRVYVDSVSLKEVTDGDLDVVDDLNVYGAGYFGDKISFTQTDGNEYIDSLADGYLDLGATTGIRVNNYVRHTSANYRRYYHLPIDAFDPGASGATWTPPSANTTGGYQLDNAGEILYFDTDVHADWDGASDLTVEIFFAVNVDNTGGGAGDTVDLKLVAYYNAVGDTGCKTQTQEVATVVGASAQYKVFKSTHTLNWDETDNVIEAGDKIGFALNLETDTSEVDNIIILHGEYYYNTNHLGIESGDI